jgi:protein associated with RNAse G/E
MKQSSKIVTINSRKYDDKIYRTWKVQFSGKKADSLLSFVGEFEKEIYHPILGVIRRGTISYEFYWLDCWYNVFRFHEPNGEFRNFYCNVNMPPVFENGFLDYTDLDIDILVGKDFSYQILDLEEFEENARIFSYPNDLREKAMASLSELIFLIENRIFPFDYKS